MRRPGMGRLASVVCACILAGAAAPAREPEPAAPPERRWVHPMALTHVYYWFDVETEGLPKDSYNPPPLDIDVIFSNLRSGRLVTIEGVGPDWGRKF